MEILNLLLECVAAMTFSQRYAGQYGIPAKKIVQLDSMDEALKTALWIAIEDALEQAGKDAYKLDTYLAQFRVLLEAIWVISIKQPKSRLIGVNEHHIIHSRIKPIFDRYTWEQTYTFIETLAGILERYRLALADAFKMECNHIFAEENAGWRFINNQIVSITEPLVLESIEAAFTEVGSETSYHLNNMMNEMAKKGEKNYRTIENEAIWAVEAYCREVTGETKQILSAILAGKKLDAFLEHKIFKTMLGSLYGYSGDESRHAKKATSKESDQNRAMFIMLQCISFINFIKGNKETL